MKVLVTGAYGQLGKDLVTILQDRFEVFGMGKEELDVTKMNQSREVVHSIMPDVIIHTAAYTAVDLAEKEENQAYLVNAFGTRNITVVAEEVGSKICYISTDYVFDGLSSVPYKEYDQTNPLGVYGKSKRAGEQLVQSLSSKFFIVRTSWVYGFHGNNFVKTMLKLAEERNHLKVVHDQVGSPTYTVDLSLFLSELITTDKFGIYHASNTGACSWYEFAKAIFEEIGISAQIEPCTTEEFPRPAPRPKYSVMDHLSIRCNGFKDFRHWRDALRDFLREFKG
ncbi:NAD(P)-dependent oxidoreductase [Collibacillus ludicampi]|uniref:dTDP-4-dehydrorhamnose reductase n=1 Tax=Collibacillus ludicampi TaxID=2771369 RepID=A0AAV4LD38_9BACL|nr:dTDP-4-dehydrorhamnose reductase [Collibacillus ludicampi]GIM45660.1 NAD(P)-dependent oxidoreductase [Collibacillus ludicampi]